jgi:tRNA-splicing ligase RtcB
MDIPIVQIDEFIFEIPKEYSRKMRTPARFYAHPSQINTLKTDGTITQLINTTTLPGIVKFALAMPDMHQGYGFPIGGVVAFDSEQGIISPGGVGYDINCGIRLATTNWDIENARKHLPEIINKLYKEIPVGAGKGSLIKATKAEFERIITKGIKWAVEKEFASETDQEHIEDKGTLPVDNLSGISERAIERGISEIGSLGSGNHFVEVGYIDKIYDTEIAERLNLFNGQVVVWVHTGSRGFGHQICADFVKQFQVVSKQYGIELPDRGLACVPFQSKEGQDYFNSMNAAANFAFVNRQLITFKIQEILNHFAKKIKPLKFNLLYDVAHNIAKLETHTIDNRKKKLVVHRKGATRAFPSSVLRGYFASIGQPVLVPGSMGTASYLLIAKPKSMELAFGSCCHGAGRLLSRSQAKKKISGSELKASLSKKGIFVEAKSINDLAEESPEAYKDIHQVVDIVATLDIAQPIARTKPLGVIKG